MTDFCKKKNEGFVAIASVLLISAVVLAISISVSLLSIGEINSGYAKIQGESTLGFVEGCTEDALLKLSNDSSYLGGTIVRPEGTCSISVSSLSGTYTLTVTGNSTNYNRTIEVSATRTSKISILSWKEI